MLSDIAEAPECIANALPAVREEAADDTLERMKAELQSGCHAEVAASAAKSPKEIGVLIVTYMNHSPVRSYDLCPDEVVARQAVLRGQVADAAAEGEPSDARGADDAWA